VLNQGIVILCINVFATNFIGLVFEFVFSDWEERDHNCWFGQRKKNKVTYIGGNEQSDTVSGILVQKLAKQVHGKKILDC